MRIGTGAGGRTISAAVEDVRRAEKAGFATASFSQIFGLDAMTACTAAGLATERIELGTFVVPTYPRHPFTMAQQAATTSDACGGRFLLGIGLSHRVVIESMLGMSFEKPLAHMREYLAVLLPLLREGAVNHQGERYRVAAALERPSDAPIPVVVAALGPKMLELAGSVADGTATWTTGARTLADHIVPTITAAAERAGRPAPRIIAGLPVCVTADVAGARERAAREFAIYGQLPSYRAMLDREGAETPGDIALVGDEDSVAAQIDALADTGVTDFNAAPYGSADEVAATRSLLEQLAKRS
jgi:F420-dependent oxidoreductase-like protein